MIPFISEEIWGKLPKTEGAKDSLMLEAWPEASTFVAMKDDAGVAQSRSDTALLMELVTASRSLKAQFKISPAKPVPVHLRAGDEQERAAAERIAGPLKHLARLSEVTATTDAVTLKGGRDVVRGFEVVLPLEDAGIDIEAEKGRLQKELTKKTKEIAGLEKKLGNEGFVNKAPADVVERERVRLGELEVTRAKLQQTLAQL